MFPPVVATLSVIHPTALATSGLQTASSQRQQHTGQSLRGEQWPVHWAAGDCD